MNLLSKFQGDNAPRPPRPARRAIALAWLGGFLAIAVVGLLTAGTQTILVLGSFGASCVLPLDFLMCPSPSRVMSSAVIFSPRLSV